MALLYVLIIVFLLKSNYKRLRLLIPILLLGDLVLGKYSLMILGREFPFIYCRNWLFVGLPYFLLGDLIKEKWKYETLKNRTLYLLMIGFAVSNLLERYVLVLWGINGHRDHYVCTTLLAISLFLLFLQYKGNTMESIAKLGRKHSTMIYIIHPTFISLYNAVSDRFCPIVKNIYVIMAPIIVFLSALIFSEMYGRVTTRRK